MRRALEEYRVLGVKTNIPFHQHMMDSHRFLSGQFDTNFVEERFSMDDREAPRALEAALLATLATHEQYQRAAQISSLLVIATPVTGNGQPLGTVTSLGGGERHDEVYRDR